MTPLNVYAKYIPLVHFFFWGEGPQLWVLRRVHDPSEGRQPGCSVICTQATWPGTGWGQAKQSGGSTYTLTHMHLSIQSQPPKSSGPFTSRRDINGQDAPSHFFLKRTEVSEQLADARCSHSCHLYFLCRQFKKYPPDSLLSSRFLYILISSSKETKEPELSEVLATKRSAFLFKGYEHTHCISVMSSPAGQEAGEALQ